MIGRTVTVAVQTSDVAAHRDYILDIRVSADVGASRRVMADYAAAGMKTGDSCPIVGEGPVTGVTGAAVGQVDSGPLAHVVGLARAVGMGIKVVGRMTVGTRTGGADHMSGR